MTVAKINIVVSMIAPFVRTMTSNDYVDHHIVFPIHGKPYEITANDLSDSREVARRGRLGRLDYLIGIDENPRGEWGKRRLVKSNAIPSPAIICLRQPRISTRLITLNNSLSRIRQPMENRLARLARRPPMTRRAAVIRWTKVFHLHLLLLPNDSEWSDQLHFCHSVYEVFYPYSSSTFSVNRDNPGFI